MTFISDDGAHLARPSTKKAKGLCYKILEIVYTFRWKHSHCFFFCEISLLWCAVLFENQ